MDNKITIFGYGSLMSITSLKNTCKSASNIRIGCLYNYIRIFNLVSIGRLKKGISNLNSLELAAVSIRKKPNSNIYIKGILFDIDNNELDEYKEREHRYEFIIENIKDESSNTIIKALVCIESTDNKYRIKCGSNEEYYKRVGQYYNGQLWNRLDILPIPSYVELIREASFELGGREFHSHFLDTSYLSNELSTLREYYRNNLLSTISNSLLDLSDLNLTNNDYQSLQYNNIKQVTSIYLNHNNLSYIPNTIFLHINLIHLTLHNNQIEEISEDIKYLTNLQSLRLDNNKLSNLPNSICKLTNLTLLHIINNKNITYLPENIGNLIKLKDLGIKGTQITKLPKSLKELQKSSSILIWGI